MKGAGRGTIMRFIIIITSLIALASCGPRVSGKLGNACMDGGRKAANAALCSCIQNVANQSLSGSDERRIVKFFEEPDLAQSTKASQSRSDDAFWDRYRDFTRASERNCRR